MELLEKRVKSRFSHRHIFIFPNEDTEAESRGDTPKSPLESSKELLISLLSMPQRVRSDITKKKRDKKKSNGELINLYIDTVNSTSCYTLSVRY
jgi:hypothetical protein